MTDEQSSATDKIDTKIIGLLLENARINFVEIGKEIGISKNTAWNRFSQMTKTGIITGATVQINYKKLGYDAVGTLLLDVEPSHVKKVSKYIKAKVPGVFGPFINSSAYNMRAIIALKTIGELVSIKEELKRKLPISEIGSSIWTDVWFTPENLSLIPNRPIELSNNKTGSSSVFNADDIDSQIISELSKDSRISFRAIASRLDVSIDTIARRYEKLREENVIVPRIQIDPSKVGYSALANFYLRVMPHHNVNTIISEIFSIPNIFYIMKCNGDFNIGVILIVKSIQDMLRTGDLLANIRGIKRVETVASATTDKWPLAQTYTSTFGRNIIAD